MPSILITGENGFIGKGFKTYSENKDLRFVSLRNIIPASIDFTSIDVVLHMAAIVHAFGKTDTKTYYAVNRDITLELAKHAKACGVKHFIFMSTIKVYGEFSTGMGPWNEFSECNPADPYGKSKYEAEIGLRNLENYNFTVSIIRTPIVYGPGKKANMLRLVRLVKYIPVLPLGGIRNKRNYTYIENLTGFIDRIIKLRKPGIFITMDNDAVSTTDLVRYIAAALHKRVLLFRLPEILLKMAQHIYPANHDRLFGSSELDNSYTRNVLAYSPPFSTEEGIKKMLKNNEIY